MEHMESRMQDQIEGTIYNERQALERIERLEKAVKELREALGVIWRWELPETGTFWDDERTRPRSYESEYGSNGARTYMRAVAHNALKNTEDV